METSSKINNGFYDSYGDKWYTAQDDPVALLRAENNVKIPWVVEKIRELGAPGHSILDVGCGGGFLANDFAKRRFNVSGIDISPESIRTARAHDVTQTAKYYLGNAYSLPFPDRSFDIVTNMDFLEHVDDPRLVVKECARVLKEDGLFFFHTFNRNEWSNFLVIKMVEKFIKNTPKNMHVIDLFIKPEETIEYCSEAGMNVEAMTGIRPVFSSLGFSSVFRGIISTKARFKLTPSTLISYMGVARKM